MGGAALTAPAARVRRATPEDAAEVRRLVAQALLAAGFPPPDPERDEDIAHFDYYFRPARAAWVATDERGRVLGCAALDRTRGAVALLRRLAGEHLEALVAAAIEDAREAGCVEIEAVLPPALSEARAATERSGFRPAGRGNDLLVRLRLAE